ncbi:MAG TPA: phenylacetate--CoA ligase PaaK [Gammaproteobacteria bacterium]|nr:phenylacetate--CoA ligase PaaK [Gammaproteobacteria bacterium]
MMSPDVPTRALLDPVETCSRDELQHIQIERLRWSLNHAYRNVPFYRRKFDQAGVHPGDLDTLEDLARFPFTMKNDLRDNYPFGMLGIPLREVVRIHASSGTTGRATVVAYSQNDIDTWANVMARCIRAAGGGPNDVVHQAFGYGLFTGGLGVHYGAERLGCTVIPMSGGQTERQVQLIRDFQPTIITVTPSYVLNIADEMVRQGMDPRETSLRIGIFGAEPWTDAMRSEIEERLDIDAVDIYGLSEVIGPGVGQECIETKDGLTLWEDLFYPEIIDPTTGEVLPDGEEGELVFTGLTKEALPIIRYRTRDLTRLLPGTARTMRRMARITGRSDDMLIVRGVNVFPSQIEERICSQGQLAPHYQIELGRDGHLDRMTVLAEPRPELGDLGEQERQALADDLRHHIKSYIGITVVVKVLPSGSVERSQGKAKRVVDNRKA